MKNIFDKILQLYQSGFRQNTEATCGPASIILSTVGLGLEPKKETDWMQTNFVSWMPTDKFPVRGIALHELQFISELLYGQRIDIKLRRAYPENFSLLLEDIRNSFCKMDSVLIVNYLQDDFLSSSPHPSRNPHYSPIVRWIEKENNILIADVDPAVTKPYWTQPETIFQSMSHINPALGIPRGWLVVKKRDLGKKSTI